MKPNEGFAKLKGYDVEFFLQKLTVTLGRTAAEHKALFNTAATAASSSSSSSSTAAAASGGGTSTATVSVRQRAHNDKHGASAPVDIPLGEYGNVSRLHARIQFNFRKKSFELVPLGKNGVRVDGKFYGKGSDPVPLKNGSDVQMGDAFFVFLLPQTPTTVKRIVSVAGSDVAETYRFQEGQKTSALVAGTLGPDVKGTIVSSDGGKRSNILVDRDTQQVYEKPTESYAVIISRALLKQPNKQLMLQDIYQYILDKFPYFQTSEVGWKSSVRHALSTNKFFKRVPLDPGSKRAIYALDDEHADQMRHVQEAAERKKREREQRLQAQREAKKRKAELKEARESKKQKLDHATRQQQMLQFQKQQQMMITHFTQYAHTLHESGLDKRDLERYQLQFMAQPEQTLQIMLQHILQIQQQKKQSQQQNQTQENEPNGELQSTLKVAEESISAAPVAATPSSSNSQVQSMKDE